MSKFILVVILFLQVTEAYLQPSKFQTLYLSNEGLNRLVNSKFNSLVTGNVTGTEVSNYASFEPLNGSFVFKGSVPLSKKSEQAKFSYLSLRLEGDLISGSYASLFTNTVLNTNSLIDGQLHFRLGNASGLKYLGIEEAIMKQRKKFLENELDKKLQMAKQDWEKELNTRIDVLKLKSAATTTKISASNELQKERISQLKIEQGKISPDNAVIKKMSEEILALKKEEEEAIASLKLLQVQTDSLVNVHNNPDDTYFIKSSNDAIEEYDKKIETLEKEAPITAIKFGWLTLSAGGSKKNYYTFYDSLSFANQLTKRELSTFRFGLSWNFYSEKSFPKRVTYLNIGFLNYRDNNLKFLSTQSVLQEKTIKNTGGDTVRKVSKTYNAYTDQITENTIWNFFANVYFIHSSKTTAFHLFPSVDWYDSKKVISNIGLGYVVSFKNKKKEEPMINAEGYVKFVDLFNKLEGKPFFWNRNEIGVNFTLPFNFFIQ